MKRKYLVNGRFLSRPITGVERVAIELLKQLDALCERDDILLACPKNVDRDSLPFKRIRSVRIGVLKGNLWEQVSLPVYACLHGRTLVNLCNTAPLFKPDVVCVHDMQVRTNPGFHTKPFVWWYRIMLRAIARAAIKVLTPSEFSRREILRHYPGLAGRVEVVGNAWQHFAAVEEDDRALARYGLASGEYYYSLSSMSANKNFKWILRAAKEQPEVKFVVSGSVNAKVFADAGLDASPNLVKTGRVTDGEAKALMRHCKAFLFPSFYEGFGLPPLEAMSTGCPVCVSNTSSLPEVFGNSAAYLDPHDPEARIPPLVSDAECRERVLGRFGWDKSARRLLSILETGVLAKPPSWCGETPHLRGGGVLASPDEKGFASTSTI